MGVWDFECLHLWTWLAMWINLTWQSTVSWRSVRASLGQTRWVLRHRLFGFGYMTFIILSIIILCILKTSHPNNEGDFMMLIRDKSDNTNSLVRTSICWWALVNSAQDERSLALGSSIGRCFLLDLGFLAWRGPGGMMWFLRLPWYCAWLLEGGKIVWERVKWFRLHGHGRRVDAACLDVIRLLFLNPPHFTVFIFSLLIQFLQLLLLSEVFSLHLSLCQQNTRAHTGT